MLSSARLHDLAGRARIRRALEHDQHARGARGARRLRRPRSRTTCRGRASWRAASARRSRSCRRARWRASSVVATNLPALHVRGHLRATGTSWMCDWPRIEPVHDALRDVVADDAEPGLAELHREREPDVAEADHAVTAERSAILASRRAWSSRRPSWRASAAEEAAHGRDDFVELRARQLGVDRQREDLVARPAPTPGTRRPCSRGTRSTAGGAAAADSRPSARCPWRLRCVRSVVATRHADRVLVEDRLVRRLDERRDDLGDVGERGVVVRGVLAPRVRSTSRGTAAWPAAPRPAARRGASCSRPPRGSRSSRCRASAGASSRS